MEGSGMESWAELQKRFGVSGIVKIDAGRGGLPRIAVTSSLAAAEIYLFGAHVTEFQPRGSAPVLFLSKHSVFDGHKPIRGGVPLVFPWFGPRADLPTMPPHGFARTRVWQIESCDSRGDGSVRIVLTTSADDQTKKLWPHEFLLRLIVVVANTLDMTLEVRNTDKQTAKFEEALHTYLAVSDVKSVSIDGLGGANYIDRADGEKLKKSDHRPIQLTGETDRLYYASDARAVVRDPGMKRAIVLEKSMSNATVVWNPWPQKAAAMSDLGSDQWQGMVCVETANAREATVQLAPNGIHRMGCRIGVEAM
jgi:glucose-6-phosphate 1-epimerase